ncbi:MAG: metallo-beta-lactamase family protein [Gemmatimonadetes bacterium]|nr:metallo-beta-lactamase family protein [Gemmatimonadota bacterium]
MASLTPFDHLYRDSLMPTSFASMRRGALAVAVLSLALSAPVTAQTGRAPISVRWLGHAAFEIVSSGGTRLLIDPFLTGNPSTPDSLKNLARYSGAAKPAAVLVTHAHDDHALDAKAIAQSSGALLISAYEWVNQQKLPASQSMGGNVGGTFKVGDVIVHAVPAIHSSEPGRPMGFVLEFSDGRSLYHTGDTWIFGDMALIQEMYHPNIILLCVGGGPYTEDPATARKAIARYFHPQAIVPMHYATFPGLATEAQVRAAFAGDNRVRIMQPGQQLTF